MSEISRAVLFGKLDTLLFTSLESATAFCKLRGNPYVELVHWLHQLMQQQDGDLQRVIRHFALDEQQLTRDIVAALDALPRGASSVSDLSEHIDSAVERAWVYGSLKFGVSRIRGGHLRIGILKPWNLANVLKSISAPVRRHLRQQQREPAGRRRCGRACRGRTGCAGHAGAVWSGSDGARPGRQD